MAAWIGPAIAGTAVLAGGLIGASQAKKDRAAAERARLAALREFEGINVPGLEEQMLNLLGPTYIGDYDPALESYVGDVENALSDISTDPEFLNAQLNSLEGIGEFTTGEVTDADEAALRQIANRVRGDEQARQKQLMAEYARRGQDVTGSGLEFAARQASNQSAAQRQADLSDDLMQQIQQRKILALQQQADLAGGLRQQEFGEKARVGEAEMNIDRFNNQNRQSLQQRNVASQNNAALRNLQERQRLAEQEMSTRNYEQEANKQLIQQQFNNRLNLANARAGRQQSIAQAADQRAGRTGEMWSGIGRNVGTIVASQFDDKDKDKDKA